MNWASLVQLLSFGLINSCFKSVMREMEVHLDQLMQEKEIDRQELAQLNNQLAQHNQDVRRSQVICVVLADPGI